MKLLSQIALICMQWTLTAFFAVAHSHAANIPHDHIKAGIESFLRKRQTEPLSQVQIEVGKIDPRLKLASCDQLENFLPPGTKEWGKITVGVRCLNPKPWTLYVAATIRVFGDYVRTTRPLSAGQQLSESDLHLAKGEISNFSPGLVTRLDNAVGKTLSNSQAAGVSVHQQMFKLIPLIQSGQAVKIFTRGAGFVASNDGIAMSNAAEGQVAKARTHSGQIISGYVTAAGSIEIR